MINNVKTFFKLINFEIKKIFKSPLVFGFLIFAPLLFSCLFGIIVNNVGANSVGANTAGITKDIVFVCDDINNVPNVSGLIEEIYGDNVSILWHTDLKQAIIDLKLSNISLIIYCNGQENQSINIIYDNANSISTAYKDNLVLQGYKYSYATIKESLLQFGIEIEDVAFNIKQLSNNMSGLKSIQPIAFSLIISFLLMIGVSYTMARDNETGVIKQLSYTPMSINKYLTVRWMFFVLLSIIQSIVILLTFQAFGVWQLNLFWGIIGISTLFSMAFTSLCLLLSTSKNQISAISLATIFIILPIVVQFFGVNNFNFIIKLILYISPITPLITTYTPYLNYEVINPLNILIFFIQIIVYFIFAFIILNKKYGKLYK